MDNRRVGEDLWRRQVQLVRDIDGVDDQPAGQAVGLHADVQVAERGRMR
jgi:hypothetical protein